MLHGSTTWLPTYNVFHHLGLPSTPLLLVEQIELNLALAC